MKTSYSHDSRRQWRKTLGGVGERFEITSRQSVDASTAEFPQQESPHISRTHKIIAGTKIRLTRVARSYRQRSEFGWKKHGDKKLHGDSLFISYGSMIN
ncbi:MAG: hypothetical protein EAZ82_10855 [Verrucomicrobia bacterium]|nr:MAG: hypothetical protein EAZ82_10855 [Verrucomicrobiota bacterium]